MVILNPERCLSNTNKTNICTGLQNESDLEIVSLLKYVSTRYEFKVFISSKTSNGAPLFCISPESQNVYQNLQYGMLLRSNQSFKNRRLFSNVGFFRQWIEKNLSFL